MQIETVINGEDLEMEQVVLVEGVDNPIIGASCWFMVKRSALDPDTATLISKSTEDGTMELDPENDRFVWRIRPGDYADFADTDMGTLFPFAVKYQAAGDQGQVTTLRKGGFRVKGQVIKSVRA